MAERRKLTRKYLGFFTRVFDRHSGDLLGHLGDITIEGAMIISRKPIPTGIIANLRIDLPEYLFGKDHLDTKAQSIWCMPDVTPEFYNTGFKFLEIAQEDTQIIERILKEYAIRG